MKKLLALGLSLIMILSLAACGTPDPTTAAPEPTTAAPTTAAPTEAPTTEAPTTEEPTTAEPVPEVHVSSYEEFLAAEKDAEITVAAFVQFAAYNETYGNVSLFLADEDGAYFVYRMAVTPEEAALLTQGTKIRVTGIKGEWAGELEFAEGTAVFEVVEGGETYLAAAKDVSALFGTEELAAYMNQLVRVSGATVEPSKDADGNDAAFLYKWNGSGQDGDDLYFNVSLGGAVYTLTVESDECGPGSEVYEAVKALEIGRVVELEGFLYWYEGPQPHIHKVSDMAVKGEGAVSHDEFIGLPEDEKVVIEGWIQQGTIYSETYGNVSLFVQDMDGAYYVWRMPVTAEEAAKLTPGVKVRVSGIKSAWSGMVEVVDATFEILESGAYLPEALDVTDLLNDEEALAQHMSRKVGLTGMTVVASVNADGEELPFLYKANGSGQEGDDLYFIVAKGDGRYTLVVESDECPSGSEAYEAVKALQIGDVIDLEGFLYWYNGPQPHITKVTASEAPSDVTMTYEQYLAAAVDDPVVISAYITQTAYNAGFGNISLFLADQDGAYYVFRMAVTPEEAELLVPGTKIRVTGTKGEWSGEVEITDATFEIVETDGGVGFGWVGLNYIEDEYLSIFMNQPVLLEGGIVEASVNADGEAVPFLYQWNGSGSDGDDIYFKVSSQGRLWTFVVESDEFGAGTDLYEAVKALKIGEALDVYAFLYWYNGPQPHGSEIETELYAKPSEEVLNYGEYRDIDPEDEAQVTVAAYIQLMAYNEAEDHYSLFLHDRIGAYYVYGLTLPEEEEERNEVLEKLVPGQYIQITGYKKAWGGEVEIVDVEDLQFPEAYGEFFADGLYFNELAEDEQMMEAAMNAPIWMSYAAVAASTDADGNEVAWLYKWNGAGQDGDDIYFKVMLDGEVYTLVVESDEFPAGSELYEAVKELQIGDVIDLEGFLYWYNGPQPHITKVEKSLEKTGDTITYREFLAAEKDDEVVVEGFVQLVTAYSEEHGNCSVFLDDVAGAYYIFRLKVTPEEYARLVPGSYIQVRGFKDIWSGEIEVRDAEGYIMPYGEDFGGYEAKPVDIANIPDLEAAEAYINRLVCGKGAKIAASTDADGNEVPFLYKWNGTGQDGDDIYFTIELYGKTYTLVVDSDEFAAGSEVYEAVKALQIGDTVDLEGFLYWYEGPQPHVCKVTLVQAAEPAAEPAP